MLRLCFDRSLALRAGEEVLLMPFFSLSTLPAIWTNVCNKGHGDRQHPERLGSTP